MAPDLGRYSWRSVHHPFNLRKPKLPVQRVFSWYVIC